MKKSVWADDISLPSFPTLKEEKSTDVLIIGGGLSGLLCAYLLQKAGIHYILVEGNTIASGITKNTTAKITSQHGLIYANLLKALGKEKAQMYLQSNENALHVYEEMAKEIPCDFEKKSAYTYSRVSKKQIEEEIQAVNTLGFPATFSETPTLPFPTEGAICFPAQAQFHPLKFITEIAKGLNIYEHTFIRDISPHTASSDTTKIRAEKIIVTTHFPFINTHGSYFLKLYQHRSYVAAYEQAPNVDGMYVDENDKGMSFRNHNGLLLIGGGGHRTGKSGTAWSEIEAVCKKNYPKAKLKYMWATQDCMSLDHIPYIGKYSANTPNLYVATGFNKWGFTSSMVAARMLCDMVQDKRNEYEELFSPQRSVLKPQFFVNGLEAAVNLFTPTTKRCPHLGCALKWNRAEHTWDCPCHGSRFEMHGRLIDNPATGDAESVSGTAD